MVPAMAHRYVVPGNILELLQRILMYGDRVLCDTIWGDSSLPSLRISSQKSALRKASQST